MSTNCIAAGHQQAPEIPTTITRVAASADTVLCPATPTSPGGAAASLRGGQAGGYAEGGNLPLRFDELPPIPVRDVFTVRLGLYRAWRGNGYDDADEMVKLVLPAPQAIDEAAAMERNVKRKLGGGIAARGGVPRPQVSPSTYPGVVFRWRGW